MPEHREHCKFEEAPTPVVPNEPAHDVPQCFEKGGALLKPILQDCLTQKIKSVNQYLNKGMKVLEWYESVNNKPSFCSGSCGEIHATTKLQNKTSLKYS